MELGDRVKDRISGFEGIVVSKTEWLYGCVRWGVAAQGLFESRPLDVQWFNDGQIEFVGPGINNLPERLRPTVAPAGRPPGGPARPVPPARDPRR